MSDAATDPAVVRPLDLSEKGRRGKEVISLDRRLFMKLTAFTDVDDFMKAQFNSVCNQTMAGFVQNKTHQSTYKNHRIQCMYATKDWGNMYES